MYIFKDIESMFFMSFWLCSSFFSIAFVSEELHKTITKFDGKRCFSPNSHSASKHFPNMVILSISVGKAHSLPFRPAHGKQFCLLFAVN